MRENRTQESARGAPGNGCLYLNRQKKSMIGKRIALLVAAAGIFHTSCAKIPKSFAGSWRLTAVEKDGTRSPAESTHTLDLRSDGTLKRQAGGSDAEELPTRVRIKKNGDMLLLSEGEWAEIGTATIENGELHLRSPPNRHLIYERIPSLAKPGSNRVGGRF